MLPRIIIVGIYAHDRSDNIFRHACDLVCNLERRRENDLVGPGIQMPSCRPVGMLGRQGRVEKPAGGVNHQSDIFSAPSDIARESV